MNFPARTAVTTALVGIGAVTVLAGCTSSPVDPEPTPSKSGLAACDLAEARVTWEQYRKDVPVELGHRVITVEGETSSFDDTMVDYESHIVGAVGDRLPPADDDAWLEFLIDDLNRTGQLQFFEAGDPPSDPADFSKFETPAQPGNYIVGFTTEQMYVPFSVACGGKTVAEGQLVTNDTVGGLGSTLVDCASPDTIDSVDALKADMARKLLDYCPAA